MRNGRDIHKMNKQKNFAEENILAFLIPHKSHSSQLTFVKCMCVRVWAFRLYARARETWSGICIDNISDGKKVHTKSNGTNMCTL